MYMFFRTKKEVMIGCITENIRLGSCSENTADRENCMYTPKVISIRTSTVYRIDCIVFTFLDGC